MESTDSQNKSALTCVLFPGVVKNEVKALQCLGGIRNISDVYSNSNKKLGLSFQPELPYVKKIFCEARKTAGVLMKVKVKKIKDGNEIKKEVVSTTVMGRVNKIYKFESLCDFQYLPTIKDENGASQCFAEQILPTALEDFDFLKGESPAYIVPPQFTRVEKPHNYAYTDKKYPDKGRDEDNTTQDIKWNRKSRSLPKIRCPFSLTASLPTEPSASSIARKTEKLALYPQLEQDIEVVRQMFEERPIVTQNYAKFNTKFRTAILRLIMPCLAIYMNDGPWQKTWVKFGCDPRKLPETRKYQTLDVRVRHDGGMNAMVTSRYRYNQLKKNARESKTENDDQITMEDVDEETVYFRPGTVPTQRQIYYQFCDIELPEVQEILAAEPPPGYLCHLTRGWLPADAADKSRDCIFKYMKDAMFSGSNSDLNIEQGSSDDESGSNSDDGDDGESVNVTATADETL
ncbi:hypothetical protein ACJJTC_012074 [Scirpophaga incertulas]